MTWQLATAERLDWFKSEHILTTLQYSCNISMQRLHRYCMQELYPGSCRFRWRLRHWAQRYL